MLAIYIPIFAFCSQQKMLMQTNHNHFHGKVAAHTMSTVESSGAGSQAITASPSNIKQK